jgi:DNA helicase IV
VLRRGLGLRLVLDGNFGFGGGLCVTCVDEVKGLEFDQVVIPDATARAYPDTPASRRALYTAMTRATRQLALLAAGEWSPLVPPDQR